MSDAVIPVFREEYESLKSRAELADRLIQQIEDLPKVSALNYTPEEAHHLVWAVSWLKQNTQAKEALQSETQAGDK